VAVGDYVVVKAPIWYQDQSNACYAATVLLTAVPDASTLPPFSTLAFNTFNIYGDEGYASFHDLAYFTPSSMVAFPPNYQGSVCRNSFLSLETVQGHLLSPAVFQSAQNSTDWYATFYSCKDIFRSYPVIPESIIFNGTLGVTSPSVVQTLEPGNNPSLVLTLSDTQLINYGYLSYDTSQSYQDPTTIDLYVDFFGVNAISLVQDSLVVDGDADAILDVQGTSYEFSLQAINVSSIQNFTFFFDPFDDGRYGFQPDEPSMISVYVFPDHQVNVSDINLSNDQNVTVSYEMSAMNPYNQFDLKLSNTLLSNLSVEACVSLVLESSLVEIAVSGEVTPLDSCDPECFLSTANLQMHCCVMVVPGECITSNPYRVSVDLFTVPLNISFPLSLVFSPRT